MYSWLLLLKSKGTITPNPVKVFCHGSFNRGFWINPSHAYMECHPLKEQPLLKAKGMQILWQYFTIRQKSFKMNSCTFSLIFSDFLYYVALLSHEIPLNLQYHTDFLLSEKPLIAELCYQGISLCKACACCLAACVRSLFSALSHALPSSWIDRIEWRARAGSSCMYEGVDNYGIPISDGVVVTPAGLKSEIEHLIERAGTRWQSWL